MQRPIARATINLVRSTAAIRLPVIPSEGICKLVAGTLAMTIRGPAKPTKDEQTKKKDKDGHTKQKDNDRTRRRAEEVWAAKIPKSRFPADSGPNCRHRGMYDACWFLAFFAGSTVFVCNVCFAS
jgi:hypothetical protein